MIPRGIRNNNPGNLKKTPVMWEGEIVGEDKIFKTFASPIFGIRAIKTSLMKKYGRGLRTIREFMTSYAPDIENNTLEYIAFMVEVTGYPADKALVMTNYPVLDRLINGIIRYENGYNPYSKLQIEMAIR